MRRVAAPSSPAPGRGKRDPDARSPAGGSRFPGSDGSFQVLENHAAMISTLGDGDITYVRIKEKKPVATQIHVSGGVVEVLNNKVTVLAEKIVSE